MNNLLFHNKLMAHSQLSIGSEHSDTEKSFVYRTGENESGVSLSCQSTYQAEHIVKYINLIGIGEHAPTSNCGIEVCSNDSLVSIRFLRYNHVIACAAAPIAELNLE